MEELATKRDFPLHPMMRREERLRRRNRITSAVNDNHSFEMEYEIRHKDGNVRYFLEYGVPIYDADGRPSHIDGAILDVTDRRTLLTLQETERKRISRDLHDGMGQILASIKMRIESAAVLLDEGRIQPAAEALNAIVPMVQQTIDEVRRISTDLRPSILDDLGISATVNWFCRHFADTYAVRVETDLAIDERVVPERLKTVVYRILQEAMNNVAKHADADLVRVSFRKVGRSVELIVDDNGRGFDIQDVLSAGAFARGLGLSSMQERVKMSGGSFSLTSARKVGTVVQAVWPVDRASDRRP
jgi:signal transduction histidine kinase